MNASWQAFYAHLCAASSIRAMPETEIPPAMRGDVYLSLTMPHYKEGYAEIEHSKRWHTKLE